MTNKPASSARNFAKRGSRKRAPGISDEAIMNSFSLALRGAGRKETTDETYRRELQRLSDFAGRKGMPDLLNLSTEHLREYFASLWKRGLQGSTISIAYRGLNVFYKWAVEEGERTDNPLDRIKPPKVEDKIQPHITEDEMRAVLKRLPAQSRDWRILRNRALVLTLYDTGMRGAELVGLKRDDVDFRELSLRVTQGKGGKHRDVFVSALTAQAIDRMIRYRDDISPALFVSRDGTPLTTNGLRMMCERLWKQAGLDFRGVHSFRRGFSIMFLRNGGDPEDLRTLAGWESSQMLRRYTKATETERAQRSHKQYSPVQSLGLPR